MSEKTKNSSIYKHIVLLPDYLRLAIKRESEYKAGFYTYIVHQCVTVLIWLVFWKIILSRIGDFGEWEFPNMVLLTGFVTINMGLWFSFVYIWRLPGEILTGKLNMYLIKPVQPFLHIILQRLNVRSLPRVLIGVAIVIYALVAYDLPYSFRSIIFAGLISFLSFLTSFMPIATICIMAFWLGRAEFLRDLFIELFVFQNYPLTEFPNLFIYVFTFIIPLIFSATVPVIVLSDGEMTFMKSLEWLLLLLGIITAQIALFSFLWKRGLRRYESYGG